jgi:hypothetical protein
MVFDALNYGEDAKNIDPTPPAPNNNVIGKKRDFPNVIHVGVGNKNSLYFQLPFLVEDMVECPRVKENPPIHQESGWIMTGEFRT